MHTKHVSLSGDTAEAVVRELGEHAIEHGYATEGYVEAVLEREREYPTGLSLPDASFGVAIPHADPDLVREEAVLLGLPPEPVAFSSMDDPDKTVEVAAVMLLLTDGSEGYNAFLSNMAALFGDGAFADAVRSRSGETVLELVRDRCL